MTRHGAMGTAPKFLNFAVLLSCAMLAGCAAGDSWNPVAGQQPQAFHRQVVVEAEGRMLLYVPVGLRIHGTKRYPLIIFLHGAAESGADLEKLKAHGLPKILASRGDFPFVVASPQTPNQFARIDLATLNGMLDELLARLPIDPDRVYLTGISMGAFMSYRWASQDPERFAAVAPVSGAWAAEDACRLKDMPIWAFHGAQDHTVAIAPDEAVIAAINACGGHARITIDPQGDHDDAYWSAVYGNPELYDWLLSQTRRSRR